MNVTVLPPALGYKVMLQERLEPGDSVPIEHVDDEYEFLTLTLDHVLLPLFVIVVVVLTDSPVQTLAEDGVVFMLILKFSGVTLKLITLESRGALELSTLVVELPVNVTSPVVCGYT